MNSKNDIIEIVIDWFQVTIFPSSDYYNKGYVLTNVPLSDRVIISLFNDLFGIKYNDLVRDEFGVSGYDVSYSFKDISIMNNHSREDMGVNILLKGSGCRDFEDLGIGWNVFFDKLNFYQVNFNRIDIAIDTFSNEYFDLELLKKYVNKGLCVSRFKRSFNMNQVKLSTGLIASNTIQFGSKASDIEITFYDKFMERSNAGYIIEHDIDFWIRTELRFRHDNARSIFDMILNDNDYSNYIFSVLYNYIDFKTMKSSDSNIRRRPTANFWYRFICSSEKIKLSKRSRERDISRIYNWLLSDTSKSQFMCYLSSVPNVKLDSFSSDMLYNFLVKGSSRVKDKDLQLINDYRLHHNLLPFSKEELLDYIQDLKNNILE